MSTLPKRIRDKLLNREYRETYIAEGVRNWVAFQIRRLRESRGMSQKEFGDFLKKPQSVVSRLEDPSYGRVTVSTLLDVAAALDVALVVQFVGVDEFLERNTGFALNDMLAPPGPPRPTQTIQSSTTWGGRLHAMQTHATNVSYTHLNTLPI